MTNSLLRSPLVRGLSVAFALSVLGFLVVTAQRNASSGSAAASEPNPTLTHVEGATTEQTGLEQTETPVDDTLAAEGDATFLYSSKSLAIDFDEDGSFLEEEEPPEVFLPTSKSLPPNDVIDSRVFLRSSKSGVLIEDLPEDEQLPQQSLGSSPE